MVESAAAKELATIRHAILASMGEHAPPEKVTTAALVASVLAVAKAQHTQLTGIGKAVREIAGPGTVLAQVVAACAEVRHWRAEAAAQTRRLVEVNPVEALQAFTRTVTEWKLSRAAQAGLRESLTGESGAVEIELTEHEVLDLVISGSAFVEVGGPDGLADTLVKVTDVTGLLKQLQPYVNGQAVGEEREQQEDRRERSIAAGERDRAQGTDDGESGSGDSGGGVH